MSFGCAFTNLAGLPDLLRRQFHFVCEGLTNADLLTCFVRVLLDPFLEVLDSDKKALVKAAGRAPRAIRLPALAKPGNGRRRFQ